MSTNVSSDPHAQLRALYVSLLNNHDHFDEFKRLLSMYDLRPDEIDAEPALASAVREQLNARIRGWLGGSFDGLSAAQALQWREILVEERFNFAASRRKEPNMC